jgi:hypothetical protein
MFEWFWKLFEKKWDVRPCGCKYYHGTFTPMEVEHCEEHEAEFREWRRNNPPEPKKDDDTYFDYGCG